MAGVLAALDDGVLRTLIAREVQAHEQEHDPDAAAAAATSGYENNSLVDYIHSFLSSLDSCPDLDSLGSTLAVHLREFLDDHTPRFVAQLIEAIRIHQQAAQGTSDTGGDTNTAHTKQSATQARTHTDEEEEVDYEDHSNEVELAQAQAQAQAQANESAAAADSTPSVDDANVGMDGDADADVDLDGGGRGSKRKREESDSPLSAPVSSDSSSKRIRSEANERHRNRRVCFDFQRRGHCNRGSSCHFDHSSSVDPYQPTSHPTPTHVAAAPYGITAGTTGMHTFYTNAHTHAAPNMAIQQQQQQWQMQQQMAMQFAMQQQYMMQHQGQQPMPLHHSNDTEISLTGPNGSRSFPSASLGVISARSNPVGVSRSGVGFSRSAAAQPQPSQSPQATQSTHAHDKQKFVRSTTNDMDSNTDTHGQPEAHEHGRPMADAAAVGQPGGDDEEEEASLSSSHRPTGSGAAIPFSYPVARSDTFGGRGRGRGRGRGGFSSSSSSGASNTRLFVSGVPAEQCSLVALSPHFAQFGNVTSLRIIGPDTAIVTFASHEEASQAMISEKAVLGNRFIRVDWAKGDGHTSGGGVRDSSSSSRSSSFHSHVPSRPSSSSLGHSQVGPSVTVAAPLSALEVAAALIKTNAQSTNTTNQPKNSQQVGQPSAPATDPTPASTTSSSSSLSDLASMKAKLQSHLLNKQLSQQKDLLSRLTGESATLSLDDKKSLMTQLATLTAQINQTRKAALTHTHNDTHNNDQPKQTTQTHSTASAVSAGGSASASTAKPKLSALEVVAQMKAKRAAAAAAATAAASSAAE